MCESNDRIAASLAAKVAKIERLYERQVRTYQDQLESMFGVVDRQAASVTAADALRDWLLAKGMEDGRCPVCLHSSVGLEAYWHTDGCLIVAYDATRPHKVSLPPDTAVAFEKLRKAHIKAGSPWNGVDPTSPNPPQPHEDRPGSIP